ncbi:hypothetical protein V6N11_019280 [Hibiscus sabdariffa]|uniref:RNase H type-1 domain-containing protein n=1 Tax=Hibiscus sabdariffa TaxID=183260 RepID=A0ABR2R2C9_9ROSI
MILRLWIGLMWLVIGIGSGFGLFYRLILLIKLQTIPPPRVSYGEDWPCWHLENNQKFSLKLAYASSYSALGCDDRIWIFRVLLAVLCYNLLGLMRVPNRVEVETDNSEVHVIFSGKSMVFHGNSVVQVVHSLLTFDSVVRVSLVNRDHNRVTDALTKLSRGQLISETLYAAPPSSVHEGSFVDTD